MKNTQNTQKLEERITDLTESIKRSNSLKWTLMKGVVGGIGGVIGASILAGIVIGVMSWIFGGLGIESLLN